MRAIQDRRVVGREFIAPADHGSLQRFIDQYAKANIFFGVAARNDSSSGDLQNCSYIRAVFADLDFKKFPSVEPAIESLNRFPLRPSIIIETGGGLHLYWLLDSPVDLQHDASLFKDILRRTVKVLGADRAAAEPARVLRVPGTQNFKYDPAFMVAIHELDTDRIYRLDDFEFLFPEPESNAEAKSRSNNEVPHVDRHDVLRRAVAYLATIPGAIQGNGGDQHTYITCCKLVRGFELTDSEAFDLLWPWNQRCQPPWTEQELRDKIRNAIRYGTQPIGSKLNESSNGRGRQRSNRPQPDESPIGDSGGERSANEGPDGEAHGKIGIDVTYQDLDEQTKRAWEAILEANKTPFLFRRGPIVRMERNETNALIVREMTPDRMRHCLARVAIWYKPETENSPIRPALPPMSIVRNVLATPDPPLPALRRIIEVPVFTADGRLHITPGYDRASGLYYEPPSGFGIPKVPSSPNIQNITDARKLILEMVQEFPFVGDAERAHSIAALLLPFVRQLIDAPTPLHLFEKPSPGTGATLLIQALAYVSMGRAPAMMTEGRDEDEWRKRITSKIATGPAIDNLRRRLDSAALSSAITATTWEDRRLGQTEIISFPVTCTWLASGNNPVLSSEMTRRTVRIRLDAKTDRPWLREDFVHPDLLKWVADERVNLIWSALILVQEWIANGHPTPGGKRLGMFEKWSDVLGGILHVAGIAGFLSNLDEFYDDADSEGAEWRNFVQAWWDKWGSVLPFRMFWISPTISRSVTATIAVRRLDSENCWQITETGNLGSFGSRRVPSLTARNAGNWSSAKWDLEAQSGCSGCFPLSSVSSGVFFRMGAKENIHYIHYIHYIHFGPPGPIGPISVCQMDCFSGLRNGVQYGC